MATLSAISSALIPLQSRCSDLNRNPNLVPLWSRTRVGALRVGAAKLPAGVEMPKVEPKLTEPSLGFTNTAETWNSRACMIGIIGTFIVELIFRKGILQMIGVDVGKGLDIPL